MCMATDENKGEEKIKSVEEADTKNEGKSELARDRTDWAMERTLLAKERTFSAWSRTGISAMVAGIGIARFLSSVNSPWVARTLGIILVATGAAIYIVGFISYYKALKKLSEKGIRNSSIWIIGIITIGLLVSAGLAFLLLFQED
jgi:putative membrane protein